MTLRLGVLGPGIDEAIDLVADELGEGLLTAGPAAGGLRWTGEADPERIRTLRRALAAREIPLTLERAPVGDAPRRGSLRRVPRRRGPAGGPAAGDVRPGTSAGGRVGGTSSE